MERGDFDFAGANYGDMTDPDGRPAGYTRWEEYKEDGGENYREMLLVNDNYKGDPDKAKSNKTDLGAFGSHYPEENIIYHVRTTDREAADGGKVLYIEELQSDWAQRGRSRGFFNPDARDPDAVKDIVDIEKQKANLALVQRQIAMKGNGLIRTRNGCHRI